MTETKKGQVVREYIKKFPEMPRAGLARLIHSKYPLLWNDSEQIRSLIRRYTNAQGKSCNNVSDKSLFQEKRKSTYNLPKEYHNDFSVYEIKQSKILVISDLHFPYQNNKAITLALDYGKKKNVNCILINGDLIDFDTISRHEKSSKSLRIVEEFDAARMFLNTLREHFPKCKIVYKLGNHDERWEKYLYTNSPAIFDVKDFELEILLKLGELKIDIVKNKRPIKIGKLIALHGHELAGGAGGVNPARSTFLKTFTSVIVGHYHKTSSQTETDLMGNIIAVNSVGCLCDLNPAYMPINRHNLGFAYVEHEIKTGNYHVENLKVIKGKIY